MKQSNHRNRKGEAMRISDLRWIKQDGNMKLQFREVYTDDYGEIYETDWQDVRFEQSTNSSEASDE